MARTPRAAARIPRMPAAAAAREGSALTLALVFAGLVCYASLYPFSGWFWPAGQPLSALIVPPWPHYHARFDDWSNFVGYMPLGMLIFASALRRCRSPLGAVALAAVLPSLLSWAMEFTQHFLPGRYPSLMDWTLNSLGACTGACLAVAAHAGGAAGALAPLRQRWFASRSGFVQALLILWPLGFLYPGTLPFGQGVSWERTQEAIHDLLADHPLAPYFEGLWSSLGETGAPMSKAAEGFAVAVGLAAPCLVAFSITRRGWRRAAMVVAAAGAGLAANTLSAALNFGPAHALAWFSPAVPAGLAFGALAAFACVRTGPRAAAALALVALSIEVALVAQAPSDPYYAESLQAWEQGRFIHFHGLAQWVGWLWPFVAGIGMFRRVVRGADPDPA
jgi:VanZ family protein